MNSKLPIDRWVEQAVSWIGTNLGFLFDFFSFVIGGTVNAFALFFHSLPFWLVILALSALAYLLGRLPLAAFSSIGLLLIWNLGYWDPTMDTLSLVLTASLISIVIGLPLGIWCARSGLVRGILSPVLDFMQTMPAFVYLIPAVSFFGLGVVPGVIASVIFAVSPVIRLTNLGIRQVPEDLAEAADAFGSTPAQKLFKVQLPLALPSIMAGVNQTIMLSLSMVVIASMIGAQGVGADVYRAVTQLKIGKGFEAGLAVVILAILLDRLTQKLVRSDKKGKLAFSKKTGIAAAAFLAVLLVVTFAQAERKQAGEGEGSSVGAAVNHTIVGIDPGAGLMKATAKAIESYGLSDWKLLEGSSTAMTAALDKAYKAKEPIVVTGWTPHWMFSKYKLKYLDDPKQAYGKAEDIVTIARKGLDKDEPTAYAFLDRFLWTSGDMEKVMLKIQDGMSPEQAAAAWIKENGGTVDKWVSGLSPAQGHSIKLAYVAWDSEIASTNVVAQVLESRLGYNVDLLQVEMGPMWAGIAGGDADAMVAAWLPTTAKDYYEQYKGRFDDLGPNLKGTKLGLVVPEYMNVDSIEDLKK